MLLTVIFVTFIAIILSLLLKKFSRQLFLASKFSGPRAYPLIGNGHLFCTKSPVEFGKILTDLYKKHGPTMRLWMGPQLMICLGDPRDVEFVLKSSKLTTKADEYNYAKPFMGEGLITSSGDIWTSHRKMIEPAFNLKVLESFVETFEKASKVFVENFKQFQNGKPFDVFPLTQLFSLDVICETTMEVELNSQSGSKGHVDYVQAMRDINKIIFERFYNFLTRYDIIFQFTSTAAKQTKVLKVLHGFTDKVISERRESLSNSNKSLGNPKPSFLDILLKSGLTDLEIRNEVDTFMAAGHADSSSGLSFALLCIAKNPDVQQKIYDEALKMSKELKGKVTMKDLNDLKYLDMVIKESMRIYPPVPLFGRKVLEEFELGGKIVPVNTTLFPAPFLMGQDPALYPEPEKFIPERFDTSSNQSRDTFSFIPFSAGLRSCIGQKFAMLSMKSLIRNIVLNYELSVEEGFEPVLILGITLKSNNGVQLKIVKRN